MVPPGATNQPKAFCCTWGLHHGLWPSLLQSGDYCANTLCCRPKPETVRVCVLNSHNFGPQSWQACWCLSFQEATGQANWDVNRLRRK
eukprot:s1242_g6.t1